MSALGPLGPLVFIFLEKGIFHVNYLPVDDSYDISSLIWFYKAVKKKIENGPVFDSTLFFACWVIFHAFVAMVVDC